jgi:beta-glucosidase
MGGGRYSFEKIPDLVKSGKLDIKVVDQAVSRVLKAKFALGMFEKPKTAVSEKDTWKHINTKEHKKLAQELDAESIVLLENKDNILPLKKDAKVAVIGPMAHGYVNVGQSINSIP